MPERWPEFIAELDQLVHEANLAAYDEDGGHRLRWAAGGIEVFHRVDVELVGITDFTPWKLTVFTRRGASPRRQFTLAIGVRENPDDPDEWLIAPHAVAEIHTDLHSSDPPVEQRGFLRSSDFNAAAELIVRERLIPEEAWEAVRPYLVPAG